MFFTSFGQLSIISLFLVFKASILAKALNFRFICFKFEFWYPLKKICGWKLPQMNMLLVVFSNGAIKEETMYQDFDDGNGSYDDGWGRQRRWLRGWQFLFAGITFHSPPLPSISNWLSQDKDRLWWMKQNFEDAPKLSKRSR